VAILECFGPAGHGMTAIAETDGRISVGKSEQNRLVIQDDPSVSRAHAVLEHVGPSWCIEDINSTNGTFVRGEKIFGPTVVNHGDEILLGRTRIVFHDPSPKGDDTTEPLAPPPDLTKTEKRVLVELCRPVLSGGTFRPPSSVSDIAANLYVGDSAIKQHLSHLFDKFGIDPEDHKGERRIELANAAIETGAVTMKDLQQPAS
jgi:FHA domain